MSCECVSVCVHAWVCGRSVRGWVGVCVCECVCMCVCVCVRVIRAYVRVVGRHGAHEVLRGHLVLARLVLNRREVPADTREIQGRYRADTWQIHGRYRAGTREMHGRRMGDAREMHGRCMAGTWQLRHVHVYEHTRMHQTRTHTRMHVCIHGVCMRAGMRLTLHVHAQHEMRRTHTRMCSTAR